MSIYGVKGQENLLSLKLLIHYVDLPFDIRKT